MEQLLITEAQIIQPLNEVLSEITPRPPNTSKPTSTLKESLDNLFPEQKYEEKRLQRAKDILGDIAHDLTPSELKNALTEIEFLANTWIDEFERFIFDGKTLNELLHEKGGG